MIRPHLERGIFMTHAHHKVAGDHLRRTACLYVRQSTPRQVFENTESTRRQYALRERAAALGWTAEAITVIDTDLGRSGAYGDREGFQKLVAEVGMGPGPASSSASRSRVLHATTRIGRACSRSAP